MVPRSIEIITDEKLEKLAASLCECFLKQRGNRDKVIILDRHKPEVLLKLKEYMDAYFAAKRENVSVQTPSTIYSVDTRFFLH